jgi:N-acetylneuraminic acid mutarotase
MIYNSTTKEYNFYSGTRWQNVNGIPQGAMIIGQSSNDSTIIKEGYKYDGFITQDYKKQVFGDTTIPAFNWYLGNRSEYQNESAPNDVTISGFTGSQLVSFTTDSVFLYNPATDKWTIQTVPPQYTTVLSAVIKGGTLVWSGTQFLLWGGYTTTCTIIFPFTCTNNCINAGLKYNPSTNVWDSIPFLSAPSARYNHKAIWTGTEMMIWGGKSSTFETPSVYLNTGGRYNPVTNTWTATSAPPAFSGRADFVMGNMESNVVFIWGGKSLQTITRNITDPCNPPAIISFSFDSVRNHADGMLYLLSSNTWSPVSSVNAPMGRYNHTGILASPYGFHIAGGTHTSNSSVYCGTCFTNGIIPTPYPCPRVNFNDSVLKTAASYNVVTNTWTTIPNSPKSFSGSVAVWDNDQFISFFGRDSIISLEPSTGDWLQIVFPPHPAGVIVNNPYQRDYVWTVGTSGNGIINLTSTLSGYTNQVRQAVYNFKTTPVTLPELKSTVDQPGLRFYLYKKE